MGGSLALGLAAPAAEAAGTTTWVSPGSDGESSAYSAPAISADGRYVVFYSTATDLVGGDGETAVRVARSDGNHVGDIFVHDRQTLGTERVSVSSAGTEANADSFSGAAITPDGRYVVFGSSASNLVPGDTNGVMDIFVRDRLSGVTERVSVPSGGGEANGESNGGLSPPAISADGRYVTFGSHASNLVADDANGAEDVFVRDRQAGATTRVSVASDGSEANPPVCMTGPCPVAGATPAISADGRYVAFWSDASDLTTDGNTGQDVFVHDRQTGMTTNVSPSAEGGSNNPSISADGRYVAFWSRATDLVPEDGNGVADIFVHDRDVGVTERASVSTDHTEADKASYDAAISPDGRYVAFTSDATNLIATDGNPADDTFLHDRQTGSTRLVSVDSDGGHATESAGLETPSVTPGGRDVVFTAVGAGPLAGNGDYSNDVYVHTFPISTLSVTKEGRGSGDVTSSPPGIACGSDCTEDYDASASVTLTAVPSGGSRFEGWSGDCSGEDVCEVTMEEARSVTATFAFTSAADPPISDIPVTTLLPTPSTAGEADGFPVAVPVAGGDDCIGYGHWHESIHRHVTPHRHERVTIHRHVSRHRHARAFTHVHVRIHRHKNGRRHTHLTNHRHVHVTNHTHVRLHRHVVVTNHRHVKLHQHRVSHVHCVATASRALLGMCAGDFVNSTTPRGKRFRGVSFGAWIGCPKPINVRGRAILYRSRNGRYYGRPIARTGFVVKNGFFSVGSIEIDTKDSRYKVFLPVQFKLPENVYILHAPKGCRKNGDNHLTCRIWSREFG